MFNKKSIITKGVVFSCLNGGYISYALICDGQVDCYADNSDEQFCNCSAKNVENDYCKVIALNGANNVCSPVYYLNIFGQCSKFKKLISLGETQIKYKKSIITKISNCYSKEKYDPKVNLIMQQDKTNKCEPKQIPCTYHVQHCYSFSDICIYNLNIQQLLIPCHNGEHLLECKHFQCSSMFKCLNSYCLPWKYVCDGKWDCPEGQDESKITFCGGFSLCTDMYKCQNTKQKCIPLGNLCDSHDDCPHSDDEMMCQFQNQFCPKYCYCLMYAVACKNYDGLEIEKILASNYISIYIFRSNVRIFKSTYLFSSNLEILQLPNNNIKYACVLKSFTKLLLLNLISNNLSVLNEYCFTSFARLKSLILKKNKILHLRPKSFYNLSNLYFLDLSFNPVMKLMSHCFSVLPMLKVLYFKNIPARQVSIDIFISTNVKVIVTKNYHVSCVNPEATLSAAHPHWYLCTGILPRKWMQALIYLISLLVILTNMIIIINQMKLVNVNHADKPIVIAISVCDLFCGLYLCIIWIADITYHQTISTTEIWRSHDACYLAFGIILLYTILRQCLLLFKSVIQLLLVYKPFQSRHRQDKFILPWISVMYCLALSLSLFLTYLLRFNSIILPTALCIPFFDPTHSILLMKIITLFIVISQTSSAAAIIIIFWLLLLQIQKSVKHFDMKRKNDKLFSQLALTSFSNIACWLLTNLTYVMAMLVPQYPHSLVIVTVILILPFKAMFMPLIFTFVQIRDKLKALVEKQR